VSTRRSTHLALAASVLPFVLFAALRAPGGYAAGTGDHAQYALHAHALADGRPYADTGYLYSTRNPVIGPRAYPPGLSFTLWPFLGLGGEEGAPFRILVLLTTALFLWTAGNYFAARAGLAVGVAVTLLSGLSLELLHHASRISSDVFFCTLVWGVIALADRAGRWSWGRVVLVALLGSVAIAFRSAGIALVPAAVFLCLVRRREVSWRPLVPAALWLGSFFALNAWLPSAASYAEQMPKTLGGMVEAAVASALAYRWALEDALLSPLPWAWANTAWHAVGILLALVGLFAGGWRWGRSFLGGFVVFYVGVLLAWPMHVVRYAWPLVPVFLALAFYGLQQSLALLRIDAKRRQVAVLALALLLLIAQCVVVHDAPLPEDPRDHPDFQALVAQLDPATTRLAVFEPRVLAWHAGVPSMGLFEGSPDEWLAELQAQGITHVVVGDLGTAPVGTASLRAAVDTHPKRFPLQYANDAFSLFQFRP